VGDNHADRKSRPNGKGRLDVELALNDLLAGLADAIGSALPDRLCEVVFVAAGPGSMKALPIALPDVSPCRPQDNLPRSLAVRFFCRPAVVATQDLEPEKRTGLSAKFASFDGVQNLRPCAVTF
jgi:hypothetical protein